MSGWLTGVRGRWASGPVGQWAWLGLSALKCHWLCGCVLVNCMCNYVLACKCWKVLANCAMISGFRRITFAQVFRNLCPTRSHFLFLLFCPFALRPFAFSFHSPLSPYVFPFQFPFLLCLALVFEPSTKVVNYFITFEMNLELFIFFKWLVWGALKIKWNFVGQRTIRNTDLAHIFMFNVKFYW